VQRLQLANEAAMKENIKSFVARLRKALAQIQSVSN